jgi:single-strand DNA-binding protein
MSDINQLTVTGRLTRDAEMKTLPTGTELLTFDLAINNGFGQYAKTIFVTVDVWGKSGNKIVQYLVKGKQVGVSGELQVQKWQDKNGGGERSKMVLSTNAVVLLGGSGKSDPEPTYEVGPDDGVPF